MLDVIGWFSGGRSWGGAWGVKRLFRDPHLLKGRRGSRIGQREKSAWSAADETPLQGALERAHPSGLSWDSPNGQTSLPDLSQSLNADCSSKSVTSGSAADTDLTELTAAVAHLRVQQGGHFTLQRILSTSIHLSKCSLNVHFLPSHLMNHLTVFWKIGKHLCALPCSLSITLGSDGLYTVEISGV